MRHILTLGLVGFLLAGCAGAPHVYSATEPPASREAPYGYRQGETCVVLILACYPTATLWVPQSNPGMRKGFAEYGAMPPARQRL
jgi:hypothetical protein